MRTLALLALAVALLARGVPAQSPAPPREQAWLEQLVGEWEVRFTLFGQPGPAGTASVRAVGEHWVVSETESTLMGAPFTSVLSVGYDPLHEQFRASWIDSMNGYLWVYDGTLDEDGRALTLMTEGPGMSDPGETARYREVIRITGDDSLSFRSSVETDDGTWDEVLSATYERKQPGAAAAQAEDASAAPAVRVEYLEIVTSDRDATCDALARLLGVDFGAPDAGLGNARTAALAGGGWLGVRAPMRPDEAPVVRPYVLVDDIEPALEAARDAGGEVAMSPTPIAGKGTFALYVLGGIQHGLWEL